MYTPINLATDLFFIYGDMSSVEKIKRESEITDAKGDGIYSRAWVES